jgi:hypothetical protein
VQLPPFSCYFIPLRFKYSPYNPVLKHPQSMFIPSVTQCFTPIQNAWQNYGFYSITFTFLDSRQEDKSL